MSPSIPDPTGSDAPERRPLARPAYLRRDSDGARFLVLGTGTHNWPSGTPRLVLWLREEGSIANKYCHPADLVANFTAVPAEERAS